MADAIINNSIAAEAKFGLRGPPRGGVVLKSYWAVVAAACALTGLTVLPHRAVAGRVDRAVAA